jgi:hypothetical protein
MSMTRVLRAAVRPVADAVFRVVAELDDASEHWAVGLGCTPRQG